MKIKLHLQAEVELEGIRDLTVQNSSCRRNKVTDCQLRHKPPNNRVNVNYFVVL